MANSKLTPSQKIERKNLKADAISEGVQIVNLDDKSVMAYREQGNTVEFALSVMAPYEQKFRVKVGEFYALDKFFDNQTVKMDKHDFYTMCEFCWGAYLD
jgi:hypothetical protein